MNNAHNNSYGQILKSTSLIGGSQIINIILGIVRIKVLALFLGPAGVGLIGLYNSITGMVGTLTGMGIGSSGVRQIAEAVGTGDNRKISNTIITLRRTAVILGLAGMTLLFLFRKPISQLTFGNTDHCEDLAYLSLIVAFIAISGGQVALIQGLRRITDLVKLNVIGAAAGTILSIIIIYFFRRKGIVWVLVAISATTILTSWWYARRINIIRTKMHWQDYRTEVAGLIKLGVVFMASTLMTAGTTYFLGVMVVRHLGLEATGIYQAAVTLSSVYIGVILGAMGVDFYPRLTAVAGDNEACNRMVNEQAEIGILLAVPGIMATLIFAPFVIQIFYSSKFILAVDILRWQILGVFLRVTCWPMAYILLAKGAGKKYFMTESAANIIYVLFTWMGIRAFGIAGTGMAFFGLYIFYWLLIFFVVRRISGFGWSDKNVRLFTIFLPSITVIFLGMFFLDKVVYIAFSCVLFVFTVFFSYRNLMAAIGIQNFMELVQAAKARLGFAGV